MHTRIIIQASVILYIFALRIFANYSFDPSSYDSQDVIIRDVAVVGGGSAGVYTAVRLQDYGKSVVIIEKNNYLGGHAETYVDPKSGVTINLGVIAFPQTKLVKDYFSRFDVPLTTFNLSYSVGTYVDFSTGNVVDYTGPMEADVAAALQGYRVQLEEYPALQAGFNLTYPVPPDLLLPYGIFLNKYNISALIPTSYMVNQGYSPLLNISTIYMLKYLNANTLKSIAEGSLTPASHNIGDLYGNILARIRPDVLLHTTVLAMDRSSSLNVKIVVSTNGTSRKLIIAKRILSTVPPQLHQLAGYDLSANETQLFDQFCGNGYYVGVLNNTGLPTNTSYTALDPSQPYDLPHSPGIYGIGPTGASRLLQVFYGSPIPLSIDDVQTDILAKVERLAMKLGYNSTLIKPDFVSFTSHTPFNLMVSNKAIAHGFYKSLYALNGKRNTFYNGAAWQTQDSNSIWEFTENFVLPLVLTSLSDGK